MEIIYQHNFSKQIEKPNKNSIQNWSSTEEMEKLYFVKITYSQGKSISNESPALTKSMNVNIWFVRTSNQLFMRFLYWNKIFEKKISYWKNVALCDRSVLYSSCYCLNIGFWKGSLYKNNVFSILVLSIKK